MRTSALVILAAFWFTGCALNAYTNIKLSADKTNDGIKATHDVANRKGSNEDALVILALSGGGSRAAYFSSLVMLSLDKLGILKEVDVISSVSGGSLPAAYYAISKDPIDATAGVRVWEEATVKDLMSRNYTLMWLGNWFWPTNIAKYWFTAYNRSDIMAQTFADNLFDNKMSGVDFKFKDINPDRPDIILNSTNGTAGAFSKLFTFTREDFNRINSDLGEYEVSTAVMASASFPSVFNYINLRNFSKNEKYVHVFDGGNSDNLGLLSAFWVLDRAKGKYSKIILILVDSFIEGGGVSDVVPDGRQPFDYIIDSNFLDSFDSLLARNRESLVEDMINYFSYLQTNVKNKVVFYHIKFNNAKGFEGIPNSEEKLYQKVNSIKTNFKINKDDQLSLEKLTELFMKSENSCLQKIKAVLSEDKTSDSSDIYCTWPLLSEDKERMDKAHGKMK
jgi:predicted acylesterase/phospholipase RssA